MNIGFVLFPNVTQLDLTGPAQILSRLPGAKVHLAAKTRDPVPTDVGFSIVPTTTFAECPDLELLCVPGGYGVEGAIGDAETMAFVRRQAGIARWVTSVCTGAFVLGAAGLLRGRKATTHWAYHDRLARVGAEPVEARVVRDGNVITGGGVTAGIDFALTVAEEIAGRAVAERIQLGMEYDPSPPLGAGHPRSAPAERIAELTAAYAPRIAAFDAALVAALADGSAAR